MRYADDFVVLCQSREEAEAAVADIRQWVADNGLRLSPTKTHLGDCRKPGEGFDFLGYRFEAGRRWVRKKSLMRFKDNIRAKTGRTRGVSLARIIADLNPLLRGWFGYFKHAHPTPLRSSTASSEDGFAPSCASRKSIPASDAVGPTTIAGPTNSSHKLGCST